MYMNENEKNSSRTNYVDKYKSELPLWQEFGTFKEACPNTEFTS